MLARTLVSLALLAPAIRAQGGGPSLYEVGTPDMGLSSAGAGARARDAATAYTNPAGMARLEGDQYLFGTYALWVVQEFDVDPTGTISDPPGSTDGGGRSVTLLPGLGTYAVKDLGPDWRLGFALNAPFAGGADYSGSWVGRAFVVESRLLGLNLEPSLAYRCDESFSLGLGVNFFYATLESKRKASTAAGAPTAVLEADDIGVGFTLGALFEPRARSRIGLTYRSPIDLELDGDLDTGAGVSLDASLAFTIPQGVSLSWHEELGKFALLSDLGWTDWSEFSEQEATVGGASSTLDRNWHDTWRVGLGTEYQLDPHWLLQAGIGYDSSAVDDEDLLPDIPFQDSWRYSIGTQYRANDSWVLGLSYTFMDRGHPDIDQVPLPPSGAVVLDGEFEESVRHFLGFTVSWSP